MGTNSQYHDVVESPPSELIRLSYQHVITGAKSPFATDCHGGILADDMGLGKTLTTLSAVVGSLDRAREFAMSRGTRSAKSTVIVVPSECKYYVSCKWI